MERYARQVQLKDFGPEAQQRLLTARVLVVGAGGLGCPVLLYLAAAGVGTLGIADADMVSLSNLHRQVLFNVEDIGSSKVKMAVKRLEEKNPGLNYIPYETMLHGGNAGEIISAYDLVVDATDNFAARYLISDACFLLGKPLVYGAVSAFEGQTGIFCCPGSQTPSSYRDLFPLPPQKTEMHTCNESGVLGIIPGMIGLMQANEVIKLITGKGKPLLNKVLTVNFSDYRFQEIEIPAQAENGCPRSIEELKSYDYSGFCRGDVSQEFQMEPAEFLKISCDSNWTLVDVREVEERNENEDFFTLHIPMSSFSDEIRRMDLKENVMLICASGQRSARALYILKDNFPEKRIFMLKGGLFALNKSYL